MSVSNILYRSFYWKTLQYLLSFTLNILLVRNFQAVIAGQFYALIYFYSFIVSFSMLGLDIGLTYFIARRELSADNAGLLIFIITIIALLFSIPAIYFFCNFPVDSLITRASITVFAFFYISGNLLLNLSSAVYTAFSQNYYPVRISCFSALIMLLFSGALFFSSERRFVLLFDLYFLLLFLSGVTSYFFMFILYRKYSFEQSLNISLLKKIFSFSFNSYIISFLFFLASKVILLLLSYYTQPASLGNYTQAYKIVEYLSAFIGFVAYPLIALLSQQEKGGREYIILFLARVANTFSLIVLLIVLATGYWLLPFVFGPSFNNVYTILLFLLPGIITGCTSVFFTSYYYGSGLLRYNLISAIVQLIISLALFYLLFSRYDIYGAAAAYSVASVAAFVFDILVFRRLYKYRLRDILFLNKDDVRKLTLFASSRFSVANNTEAK